MEISKTRLGRYALLKHKKYREKNGLFIVQGKKAVTDIIDKFEVEAILCLDSFIKEYEHYNNVLEITPSEMKKVSTLENLPEIIAVCRIPVSDTNLKPDKETFNLVLDGIQDPGNLGTIIRTAHWFGVKKIFCSKNTVDIYNPKVVMGSMGSIASVKVEYCDIPDLFNDNAEMPVYGLLLNGDNIFNINNLSPGFLLMGSEGHGPSVNTCRHITRAFTIPAANPSDSPDSLNVAIATAITLSQLLK